MRYSKSQYDKVNTNHTSMSWYNLFFIHILTVITKESIIQVRKHFLDATFTTGNQRKAAPSANKLQMNSSMVDKTVIAVEVERAPLHRSLLQVLQRGFPLFCKQESSNFVQDKLLLVVTTSNSDVLCPYGSYRNTWIRYPS